MKANIDLQTAKKRVLVVDDEADYLYFLSFNLEARGTYQVEVVNKAEEALSVAQKFRPDIILLDLLMPKMNGAQVALQIKRDRNLSKTPIVFMTGSNLEEIEQAKLLALQSESSKTPLIVKPATLDMILQCIDKILAEKNFGKRPQLF